MSQTLWGVVIGAVAATIMPVITLVRDSRRWRTEQKLALLLAHRQRLENMFQTAAAALAKGMQDNSYSTDTLMASLYLFPNNVHSAIEALMAEAARTPENLRSHYADVVGAMKLALAEIDHETAVTIKAPFPAPHERLLARAQGEAAKRRGDDNTGA